MLEEAGTDPGASPSPTPSAADGQAEPASSTRPGTPLPRRGILVALGAAVAVMIVAGVGVGLTRGGGIGARPEHHRLEVGAERGPEATMVSKDIPCAPERLATYSSSAATWLSATPGLIPCSNTSNNPEASMTAAFSC